VLVSTGTHLSCIGHLLTGPSNSLNYVFVEAKLHCVTHSGNEAQQTVLSAASDRLALKILTVLGPVMKYLG